MRNSTRRTSLVLAGAVAASIAAIAPASAETTTTFAIQGGSLSVSQQPASADLGTAGPGNLLVSGNLGDVVVSDERNGVTGWTATVVGTDFVTGGGGQTYNTVSKGSVLYEAGVPAITGVVAPAPGVGTLDVAVAAMTGAAVVGNNEVAWNPLITVTLEAEDVAGTYTGTITHSVA